MEPNNSRKWPLVVKEAKENIEHPKDGIIVDTCVLIDMFVKSRSRHSQAQQLVTYLHDSGRTVMAPMHAMFEFKHAWDDEKASLSSEFPSPNTKDCPLQLYTVWLDATFFNNCYRPDLPRLKAGDMIFVALAKSDGKPLITEDSEMHKKANEFGVDAYTIQEFLDQAEINIS